MRHGRHAALYYASIVSLGGFLFGFDTVVIQTELGAASARRRLGGSLGICDVWVDPQRHGRANPELAKPENRRRSGELGLTWQHVDDEWFFQMDTEVVEFGEGRLGMPLGLPAMTDEQFGILRAWIEQGCPGPTKVTGRPDKDDGFLVPDGPIKKNKGCELRAPADPPPKWAIRAQKKKPADK